MEQNPIDMKRRTVLRTATGGLVGIVASGLLPSELAVPHARAAVVTPNPIGARIQKSGVAVEIGDFASPPASSGVRPYAALNHLYHAGDGSRRLFVCDSRGKLWRIDPVTGGAALFLDVAKARGSAFVTGQQTGLRSFAFHPDFARSGRAGFRRLYTTHTETAGSRPAGVKLFAMAAGIPVSHHNVVAEWRHVPASELRLGSVARLRELALERNGAVVTQRQLVGHSERVDLRFGEGEDGTLYVLTKQDGKIRKLRAA